MSPDKNWPGTGDFELERYRTEQEQARDIKRLADSSASSRIVRVESIGEPFADQNALLQIQRGLESSLGALGMTLYGIADTQGEMRDHLGSMVRMGESQLAELEDIGDGVTELVRESQIQSSRLEAIDSSINDQTIAISSGLSSIDRSVQNQTDVIYGGLSDLSRTVEATGLDIERTIRESSGRIQKQHELDRVLQKKIANLLIEQLGIIARTIQHEHSVNQELLNGIRSDLQDANGIAYLGAIQEAKKCIDIGNRADDGDFSWYQGAQRKAEEAIGHKPTGAESYFILAHLSAFFLTAIGDPVAAASFFQKTYLCADENSRLWVESIIQASEQYAKAGQFDKAYEYAHKLKRTVHAQVTDNPDKGACMITLRQAATSFQTGSTEEGIELFKELDKGCNCSDSCSQKFKIALANITSEHDDLFDSIISDNNDLFYAETELEIKTIIGVLDMWLNSHLCGEKVTSYLQGYISDVEQYFLNMSPVDKVLNQLALNRLRKEFTPLVEKILKCNSYPKNLFKGMNIAKLNTSLQIISELLRGAMDIQKKIDMGENPSGHTKTLLIPIYERQIVQINQEIQRKNDAIQQLLQEQRRRDAAQQLLQEQRRRDAAQIEKQRKDLKLHVSLLYLGHKKIQEAFMPYESEENMEENLNELLLIKKRLEVTCTQKRLKKIEEKCGQFLNDLSTFVYMAEPIVNYLDIVAIVNEHIAKKNAL